MFRELQGQQNHDFGQWLDNVAMQLAVCVNYPLSSGEGREVRVPQHSYPNSDKHATTLLMVLQNDGKGRGSEWDNEGPQHSTHLWDKSVKRVDQQ